MDNAPTLAPVEELVEQIPPNLTRSQLRYLTYLADAETRQEAATKAEVSLESVYTWRSRLPGFQAIDDAIADGRHSLRTEVATSLLRQYSAKAALDLTTMASMDAKTDRQLQAKLQAIVKVLEASNVITRNPAVQVNIDNRRIDQAAITRWQHQGQGQWKRRNKPTAETKPNDSPTIDAEAEVT